MNFLSHFYFDGLANQPYWNLGLVLPDFMGMVQRGWKIRPHQIPEDAATDDHDRVLVGGIKQHLRMDEFFHGSYFFKENNRLIRNYLASCGIKYPPYRVSFVSHVFLEILMDRILVKQDPSLARQFYQELGNVALDRLKAFFRHYSLTYNAEFDRFINRFLKQQFLFDYAEDEAFFRGLNGVFRRVRQPEFDSAQIASIRSSLPFLEDLIWQNFFKLQTEMEKRY